MKHLIFVFICFLFSRDCLTSCAAHQISVEIVDKPYAGQDGTFVLINCSSGMASYFPSERVTERLAPCSTFKIVNALIALELGIVDSADAVFYKWDGQKRSIPAWNKDLSFKEAFQASCVPAFQNLSRKIGVDTMQSWITKLGYGNQDISAGIDVFWLPATHRKTILISPQEQAELMCKIVQHKLPFSPSSLAVLQQVMRVKKTSKGILFGKTGSGTNSSGVFNLGWFVGYVESKKGTYAFACAVQGAGKMSKDARAIVEKILCEKGLL